MHDGEPLPPRTGAGLVGRLTRDAGIGEATAAYEAWLARYVPLIAGDIDAKHAAMASGSFPLLRATAYRWAQRWPALCADLVDAPVVAAVGDLHVENFGTWRDSEGRLSWGINDVDETAELPYTSDLVRLVTSAVLAARESHLSIDAAVAASAVADGYRAALDAGGAAFVLAEDHRGLRDLATASLKDPTRFWDHICRGPEVDPSGLPAGMADEACGALPAGATDVVLLRRTAGAGSLGRPRVVAVARLAGSAVAREAKSIVPSAWAWAAGAAPAAPVAPVAAPAAPVAAVAPTAPAGEAAAHAAAMRRLVGGAVRAPDPGWATTERFLVRRLAPDCSRIELADLPAERDERRLLHAMGAETANMHLATPGVGPRVASDFDARAGDWLVSAATRMASDVEADQREWKAMSRARAARPGKLNRGG